MSKINVTRDAKMFIGSIYELLENDGLLYDKNKYYPRFLVIETIRGIKSDEIIENGYDNLKLFGWGKNLSTAYIEEINELLRFEEFIKIDRHRVRYSVLGYKWFNNSHHKELFLSASSIAKRKTMNIEKDVNEYFSEKYKNESHMRKRTNSPYEQQDNEE